LTTFVEVEGREGDVTIKLPRNVRATETTLLEDVIVGPVGEGTTIKFHMKPWEIKTLRFGTPQTDLPWRSAEAATPLTE